MGYIKTGLKRSLTATISKEVNGSPVTGYPRIYNGQTNPVTINFVPAAPSIIYSTTLFPTITSDQLGQLSDADYASRLDAFKAYISSMETGIDFGTDIVKGFEPTVTDILDCPPPAGTTTTTTTIGGGGGGTTLPPTTLPPTTLAHAILNLHISYGGTSGDTSGFSGIISVFGQNFNTSRPYETSMLITKSVLYNTLGHVILDGIATLVNGDQVFGSKYWKVTGSDHWINFTSLNQFNLNISPEVVTMDIDILITDIALENVTTTTTTLPVTTSTTTLADHVYLELMSLTINPTHTDKLDYKFIIVNGTGIAYDTKVRVRNVTRGSLWTVITTNIIEPHTTSTPFQATAGTLIFANVIGDQFEIQLSNNSGIEGTYTCEVRHDMGSQIPYSDYSYDPLN